MKTQKTISLSLFAIVFLISGCGGGSSSNASSPPELSQTVSTVVNPFTGTSAPGMATTILHGIAPIGATVTAYNLEKNGTSSVALGQPVTSTENGVFTLNLKSPPSGMVRVVATGGTEYRSVDNSVQPVGSMELVTPFLTTQMDYFVISPITDIAARIMLAKAQTGMSINEAFKTGMRNTLMLDIANAPMADLLEVYFNVLRGSIKRDSVYNSAESRDSAELKRGLENFGIMYDLPSQEVRRLVAAAGAADFQLSAIDVTGQPIIAGAWKDGVFDRTAPVTLKNLMDSKTPQNYGVFDNQTGKKTSPSVSDLISKYMIMDEFVYGACITGNPLLLQSRYPYYGSVAASECVAVTKRYNDLKSRVATNNSSKMR